MPKGSTSFGVCGVQCCRWLFGYKIPVSSKTILLLFFCTDPGLCQGPPEMARVFLRVSLRLAQGLLAAGSWPGGEVSFEFDGTNVVDDGSC